MVMIHEYRFPVDEYIYSLPRGPHRSRGDAGTGGTREMLEETGFVVHGVHGRRPVRKAPVLPGPGLFR